MRPGGNSSLNTLQGSVSCVGRVIPGYLTRHPLCQWRCRIIVWEGMEGCCQPLPPGLRWRCCCLLREAGRRLAASISFRNDMGEIVRVDAPRANPGGRHDGSGTHEVPLCTSASLVDTLTPSSCDGVVGTWRCFDHCLSADQNRARNDIGWSQGPAAFNLERSVVATQG